MSYNFLHVSDLHFRANWPEQTELLLREFIKDIKGQKAASPNAYLIFSGDLVQAGSDENYTAFLARLDAELSAEGFPSTKRICVPGNHDISRGALKPKMILQQGVLSAMADEETFNKHMDLLSEQYFNATFENYKACEQTFAGFKCCHENVGGAGWTLAEAVGVYCMNTALCSYGGLEDGTGKKIVDKGLLRVDTRSLYRWINEAKSKFRILVMHHPL